MNQTICILGRQPQLGMAELESLFGPKLLQPLGKQAAIINEDPLKVDINRLGGTLKVSKLLAYISSTELSGIIKYVSDALPKHLNYLPAGKVQIGLSFYGFGFNPSKINAAGLQIKKQIKSKDRGVRIVPNKQAELNAAQVIHNHLTGPSGLELVFIKSGKRTVLAQTTAVQDIEAYAARDQKRPKRDAKVGMLPPKLAQIIINLADPSAGTTVLDPFCGTGVLLQEAMLMGYNALGTDLEPRMVEYAETNLDWLNITSVNWRVRQGDATATEWSERFDTIAAETYLGRPFSALPDPKTLNSVVSDVDTIHRKFLQNAAAQTQPGFKMCIAVPAWRTKNGFKHLPTLEKLQELGYTRQSFVHAPAKDLIYHREGQVVGRELVVLTRT